jgi:hypothetical protein
MLEQALNEESETNPISNDCRPQRRTAPTIYGANDAETEIVTDPEAMVQVRRESFIPEQYLMDHVGGGSSSRLYGPANSDDRISIDRLCHMP